jgi:hypothetical protein
VKPFLLPFHFNILVLVPVGLSPLSGGAAGGPMACPGKFPESEGCRTVLGSLGTGILIGSVLGLFFPAPMSPLLLTQVIYKTLWLLAFVLPRLVGGRSGEVPWDISLTFLVIIVSYPWVIP